MLKKILNSAGKLFPAMVGIGCGVLFASWAMSIRRRVNTACDAVDACIQDVPVPGKEGTMKAVIIRTPAMYAAKEPEAKSTPVHQQPEILNPQGTPANPKRDHHGNKNHKPKA